MAPLTRKNFTTIGGPLIYECSMPYVFAFVPP